MAVIFDGREFAANRERLLVQRMRASGIAPKMVSVFFREDPASILFTNLKQKVAKRVGIGFHAEELSLSTPLNLVTGVIGRYSENRMVDGVMVQKPVREVTAKSLPVEKLGFDDWWQRITSEINPAKDVDCLTRVNLERVYRGRWRMLPATVRAVLAILEVGLAGKSLFGLRMVVVGRSELVGLPLSTVLAQRGAQVSLCGSTGVAAKNIGNEFTETIKPEDLATASRNADVVVSASGKPGLLTGEMVKKGAVVIDVGSPLGDIDFASVSRKARFITPVPGGVGPVTVVSLLENLVDLVERRK